MMNDKYIAPCPHCGSSAREARYSGAPVIWCNNEKCFGGMGGEEFEGIADDLLACWNSRATANFTSVPWLGLSIDGVEVPADRCIVAYDFSSLNTGTGGIAFEKSNAFTLKGDGDE